MNKPIVTVQEKKYSVFSISVVLKLNSGPLLHLRLSEKLDGTENKQSNEESFKQEFLEHIYKEGEGSFQWQGTTLKFILVGFDNSESPTFELVGLAIGKDVIEWFNQNNFKDKNQDYLIYQKSNEGNSWPWLNKVLGNKFEPPNPDFIDKIKSLFPDHACIWRSRDSNNFHFLNRAIAFASRHLPEVQGWCAFDCDKPLRLILFEEKKQDNSIPKLDQTWNPSHLFLPNRYSWNRWLDRSCTLSRDLNINTGQEIALIKQLVSDGSNGEDAEKGKNFQAQNPTRLLFTPGTINIGDRNIFCHTVSYEFKLPVFGEKDSPSVTMKIEMDYPERQIGDNEVVSLRLQGKFQTWDKEKDEETKVKIAPPDLNNWGIIDEKTQTLKSGNDAVLYTQILSPTYSDQKYSGIYIKHEKDDEMIVDIHPCGIPLVLGSVQKYRPELEKADITLCGEKLAISVSSHNQSLDNSEAIILDNSEIKLNHGKKIFGQAQQKVDFLSQNIELGSSQIEINSGQTKINSAVNVSFPSPKVPTPNVPSSPAVAGLVSGEIGGANKSSSAKVGNISSAGNDNSSLSRGAVEQSVVNTFGMDVDSPIDVDAPEVDRLADQFSKMSLQDKVNTFNLNDNCYYCTAAALLNMTVDELIRKSEIMQYAGGGTTKDIKYLFKEAGVSVNYQTINSKDQLESEIEKMQNNDKFGFAYYRQDGTGHMVVLDKNQDGDVRFLDYQKEPPGNQTLEELLKQENITTARVFSPSATGTPVDSNILSKDSTMEVQGSFRGRGKPASLKQEKHTAKAANRHTIARPQDNAPEWARTITTKRVADLFRTANGLPGHWQQIQQEVNSGIRQFTANGKTTEEGKELLRYIGDAIIEAAGDAQFDFQGQEMKLADDMGWLKISRNQGKVNVTSKP